MASTPLRRRIVSGVALGLAMCVGLAAQTTRGAKHMSVREIQVQRVTVISSEAFDEIVARVEAQIGHTDLVEFHRKLSAARNEAEMKNVAIQWRSRTASWSLHGLILETF
jgi:hypothetical protein